MPFHSLRDKPLLNLAIRLLQKRTNSPRKSRKQGISRAVQRRYLLVCLFAIAHSVAACAYKPAPTANGVSFTPGKWSQGLTAVSLKDYKKAETLWVEGFQEGDENARNALFLMENLVVLYAHGSSTKFKEQGKLEDPQKELYYRMKIVEHPLNKPDPSRPFLFHHESRIADLYREGLGTAKDLSQACL
jgi:hypothetical protein